MLSLVFALFAPVFTRFMLATPEAFVLALGGIAMVAALTKYRLWGYLWHEWFTSIDHKKIGIM